ITEIRNYYDQSIAALDASLDIAPNTPGLAVTHHSYDALGNRQTQTDALGRVTSFWSDRVGRRTERILPKNATEAAALTETFQYDGWGDLWKRTDFTGKTTIFSYDALNR